MLHRCAFAHDITPADISADGTCARFVESHYKCTKAEESKTKTSKEVTGVGQWNSETYFYCRNGKWFYDRKQSFAVNDSGPAYIDRCKYVENFKLSKLEWKSPSERKLNWEEAKSACSNLQGSPAWRLPNYRDFEMEISNEHLQQIPHFKSHPTDSFWSQDLQANDRVWILKHGKVESGPIQSGKEPNQMTFICVRDAK